MRKEGGGTRADVRSSALWGSGSRGRDSRSNALWGKSGRGLVALGTLVLAFAIPASGMANGNPLAAAPVGANAVVPKGLLAKAGANPLATYKVIIQGKRGYGSAKVAEKVRGANGKLKKQFRSINGVAAEVNGLQLQ